MTIDEGGDAAAAVTAGPRRVAVIGAGLVGGSVAAAARSAGVAHVALTDADAGVRARAAARGLAHEVTDTVADAVRAADLVVAAVPGNAVPAVLAEASRHAPAHTVFTDVASLKRDLTVKVESTLRENGRDPQFFVGGHPMAGSEQSGPEAADAHLFQAATWVLTPTPTTADEVLRMLSTFLRRLGARVLVLSPARHDQLVAIVSHLPQVVASALADVAADAVESSGEAVLAVAGGGFRDTTRIAASNPDLWLGILRGNQASVLEALDDYRTRLDELRETLAGGHWEQLAAILTRASAARRRLVPKAVGLELVDLVVPLADRPGAIAAATTVLGEAGVNVEDLTMRHAAEGERGALVMRIGAAATAQAIAALDAHGIHAHVDLDALAEVAPGAPDTASASEGAATGADADARPEAGGGQEVDTSTDP